MHKLMRKYYYYDYKFSFNQDFLKNIQDKKERKFQKIVCYYLPCFYISILYILLGLPMSLVLSFVTTWCMRFFTFLTKFLKPFINVVYGSICIIATSRSFRIFYKVFSGRKWLIILFLHCAITETLNRILVWLSPRQRRHGQFKYWLSGWAIRNLWTGSSQWNGSRVSFPIQSWKQN